jgi:oxygen-dependent protoporphyrinogen oxidase
MTERNIAVIGGGPAGCAAAWRLHEQGARVTLFERADCVGGRTTTFRKDGFALDTGAAFITNFYPRVFQVAEELGFRDKIRSLHRISGLHQEGRTARLNISSPISFLRFPLIGILDKLKMGLWTVGLTLKRGRYDLAEPATLREVDGRSVAQHVRDVLNERIYDILVRPGIEPFWYFSGEEVSEAMALALTSWAAGAKFYSVQGGIDQICTRLVGEGPLVRTGTEVVGLVPVENGIQVTVKEGDAEESLCFDGVVLATTANIAAQLTQDLPEEMICESQRAFLNSQRYAANIHACFRVPLMNEAPGMSAIFPCGPGLHTFAALSFHQSQPEQRVDRAEELVSLYLPGHVSEQWMDKTDDQIFQHCIETMRRIYPSMPSEAHPFFLARRRQAIPVHEVGRYILADEFQQAQRRIGGPVWFCGDYLTTATVEASVASGFAAAEAVEHGRQG